jgi:hypothetical protein
MNTPRERKRSAPPPAIACWLLVSAVLHGVGCGGEAGDAPQPGGAFQPGAASPPATSSNPAPVSVPARAATPEPVFPQRPAGAPDEEEPLPAVGLPIPDGVPEPVRALLGDPPEQLDETQFSALLDHYCVTCHTTPSCSAACDGFFFDDWQDLAAGGNGGPASSERVLSRVVERMSDGSMPPASIVAARGGEVYDLPAAPRARMIEFIRDELDASAGGP